jgi:hypothetical protein
MSIGSELADSRAPQAGDEKMSRLIHCLVTSAVALGASTMMFVATIA